MTNKVEVTQSARDAAAALAELGSELAELRRSGAHDNLGVVQAIAAAEQRGFKLCQDAAVKRLEGKAERARVAAIGNGMDPSDATLLDYEFSLAADELRTLSMETGNGE